jgi:hypothetical protein
VIPLASVALALATPGPRPPVEVSQRSAARNLGTKGKGTMSLKYIWIEGRQYLWRAVLRLRREQVRAHANARQPALFELKDDSRPAAERTAAGRYLEPSLFTHPERRA